MKDKKLLIVERCNSNLQIIEEQLEGQDKKSIVLTGLFTTFGTKNRNGRIYESADFIPHVEALKEAIKNRTLLGEMDHPHSFETSLSNVSHVVESLEYDPQQNAIVGKIRLLNTARGLDAQSLVRDGIPLNISSRAAGTVDESGRVKLQQLFTYDLVAEPGFANAQLHQINEGVNYNNISDKSRSILVALNENYKPNLNESYGLYNDNVDVYEISENNTLPDVAKEGSRTTDFGVAQTTANVTNVANNGTIVNDGKGMKQPEQIELDIKNNNNMDNGQYILYSDFQKYSEHLSDIITDLQDAIANYKVELANMKDDKSRPTEKFDASNVDNTMIASLVAKEVAKVTKDLAVDSDEQAAAVVKAEEMEEKYNNLVSYMKYLAENLDKSITHQDYVTEETNKIIAHNNYLAEKMNQMVEHQDYLAENMNNMIAHQDYLAENLNDTIGYQNYVAEMLDKSIDYSNMIAEEQNKTIAYNNYLSEKMNQMVDHQDYLAENMNSMISHQDYLAENMNNMINHTDYIVESINSKNKNIIEENEVVEVPANKTSKPQFNSKEYQSLLSEKLNSLINTVKTQYAEVKQMEKEALEESRQRTSEAQNFNLINYIPKRLSERWSKLSDTRKQEILAESKMFVINNDASAEYFWNTRDLREKQIQVEKIEENVTAQPLTPLNQNVMSDERYKMMMEQIKRNMRKY